MADESSATNLETNRTNRHTGDKQASLTTITKPTTSSAPGLKVAKAFTKKSKGKKKASRRGIVDDDDWGNLEDWSDSDENLSDDTDEAFEGARLSESVRSRGRPAIKRSQKSEQKSKRMKTSKEEAMRLVLGTLVPVKKLKAVRVTLAEACTVLSAMPVLGSLIQADAPQWKRTRFVILSKSRPTLLHVTEVYPLTYVKKCISGINTYRGSLSETMRSSNTFGVKITGVGTIKEEDILTMARWHSAFKILEGMADTILWVRSSKYDRISLGSPFNDTVEADIGAFANRLEELPLSLNLDTLFGAVPASELQWFRRNEWFQDPTFKIVLGYLKELGFHVLKLEVGIVNPMHSHISDVEPRRELISSNWAIRIFDPMQSKNNYLALEKQVNEVVPTIARKFTMKRVTSPYQEDMNNCGLYCAIFFECQVRGVPMPDLRRTVLGYLRFRYLFKACAGDREWK
ncbi:hypothetical protein PF005_g2266 [Phytophthora fragariae]|uniref:Ubiquitin-like protease family profile domain-containing protein n=1 Tax=Phytophthora fragariae TaxID=53985 RepID=A0A6A3ZB05_9STRA|nr:hypothetical protein PF003_g18739 [Phytophthora fragariae]KAE9233568.1 hypothetical protein PF005_g2266 [Phytophthora fragariae]